MLPIVPGHEIVGKATRVGGHVKGFKTADLAAIGGIAETQEMLDFCAEHNIVADIELIKVQQVNEAFNRLEKGDVKYRFVIDMASLKN